MQAHNKTRVGIAGLVLSAAAFVGILTREGYTDEAIIPVKGDTATYGFGTTGGVKMGDKTNPVAAVQRAMVDAQKFEGALKKCVEVPLSQAEYDTYVSFSYNVGSAGFCNSTIVKRLNAGDYRGACDAILMWRFVAGYDCATPGNKRCYGLWVDRLKTHKTCMEAQI